MINIREAIHPIILSQMPGRRNFELRVLNQVPKVEGPILYLVTHSSSHDAPVVCEFLKKHFYILVGKQPLEILDKVFFYLNGQIFVDRDNKESGQKASLKIIDLLNSNIDVVMFPERTWCTKPSTPINHCKYGWVDIAKKTKVSIIPIALEYYEFTDNCCYINCGDPIIVNENDSKLVKNFELEEKFVTLKEEIWSQFGIQKRSEISANLWNEIMQKRYDEYPKLNPEKEKKYVMGWQDDPDEVFKSPEFILSNQKIKEIYGENLQRKLKK